MELQNSIKCSHEKHESKTEKNHVFAGPLNLNKVMRQASTVMNGSIALNSEEFDALFLMASNEGEFLTFQQIYEVSWGKNKEAKNLDTATSALNDMVEKINEINKEFMWIESTPGMGYRFNTRWGHNWNSNNKKNSTTNITNITDSKTNKTLRHKMSVKTLITGAGALVAILMLALLYILQSTGLKTPPSPGPVYIEAEIEDSTIPLGTLDLDD